MYDKYKLEISVIMAVYNTAQFLEESIESILNQTYPNFEFIIVYDVSTDNSKEIIEKYMKTDNRIIFIENEKKLGVAAARNRGLEIAKGQYIAIMDSDDISMPDRLKKEYLFLENNKDVYLVGSNGIRIDEEGEYLADDLHGENPMNGLHKGKVCIIHTSIMFRNKKIMYREKFHYAEDYDLYLRLLSCGLKLVNIDEILVKYRMRDSGLTLNNETRIKLFSQKALEFYNQRLENGKDNYKLFDEKEIFGIPIDNSRKTYLKAIIGFSLKNRDTEKAKKYFEEYSKKISFVNRIKYKIVLTFPIIYPIRFKIKLFHKRVFQK